MEQNARRRFLSFGIKTLVAIPATALLARRATASNACVADESEPLRAAMNYADPSPHADKRCELCGYFDKANAETASGASCARCQIMMGPVSATAYCDSWAAPTAR